MYVELLHSGSLPEIVIKPQDYLEVGCLKMFIYDTGEWGEGSGEKGCTRRGSEKAWVEYHHNSLLIYNSHSDYLSIHRTYKNKSETKNVFFLKNLNFQCMKIEN